MGTRPPGSPELIVALSERAVRSLVDPPVLLISERGCGMLLVIRSWSPGSGRRERRIADE
jgi:hypothetical protein